MREAAASKENSPVSFSDSGVSIDTSLSKSTKATSISGHNDVSRKRAYTESHLGDEPVRKKHKIEVAEDLMSKWIAALQRLVKGKTKIGHKVRNESPTSTFCCSHTSGHGGFEHSVG